MNKVVIGNESGYDILAYENALLCYVYGRVTFNAERFIFLLPSIFFLFQHAMEISIKTLLKISNMTYANSGKAGHKIYNLLLSANKGDCFSDNFCNLSKNTDLINLLHIIDNNYLKNKYEFPGYTLDGDHFLNLIDQYIVILFEEINIILDLKKPKHALAQFQVPKSVEKMFLFKLNKQIVYTALDFKGG